MLDHLLIASVLVGLNATQNGKSGTMVLLPEMSRKLGTISRLPNEKCSIYRYFFGVERCGTMQDHAGPWSRDQREPSLYRGWSRCPALSRSHTTTLFRRLERGVRRRSLRSPAASGSGRSKGP